MIINSIPLMTFIDIVIFCGTMVVGWQFLKNMETLRDLKVLRPIFLMLLGLFFIAIFYLVDLVTMFILPLFMTMTEAMAIMWELHLNWKWLISLFGVGFILSGLFKLIKTLFPHIIAIQSRLKGNLDKLEIEVERKNLEFGLILDTAGEGIYGLDLNGKTTFINPAGAKMTGWEMDELIGKHQHSIIHHSRPDGSPYPDEECPALATFKYGKIHHVEDDVFWRKDGSSFEVEYTSSPMVKDGQIIGSVVVFRDISNRKKAQDTIVESARKYRQLMDSANDAILVADAKTGVVLESNRMAAVLLGRSAAEISGMQQSDLHSHNSYEEYKELICVNVENPYSTQKELSIVRKNGDIIPVEIRGSLIEIDGKQVIQSILRDISERKHNEELQLREHKKKVAINNLFQSSLEQHTFKETLEIALAQILFGSWIVTKEKGSIFIYDEKNSELTMAAQIGMDEQVQLACARIAMGYCLCGQAAQSKKIIYASNIDERHEIKYSGMKPHGHYCIPILSHEKLIGVINLYLAEEHQRDPEEEEFLMVMANSLAGVIEKHQTDHKLELAKQTAEDANQAKSDFLANMSHEIRTPMNAVVGMTHLISQTDLSEKQQDYVEKIKGASQSLLGIINDILDFSKIEARKLDLEFAEFHLSDVINSVMAVVDKKATNKMLKIIPSIPANVPTALIGDSLRLGQILSNLLTNAVKFTESGKIILAVEVLHNAPNLVRFAFSIQDSGIGMTNEQQKSLFQPFHQADTSTTREYGGTGLGLAICKELVGMMGGSIQVKSAPNEGTTVNFSVAFGRQPTTTKSNLITPDDLHKMRVLVVNDHAPSRSLLMTYLRSFKFLVDEASTGEAALDKILAASTSSEESYKLILMDWRMPGMDGIQTSIKIRKSPDISPSPYIILVTAFGREEIAMQSEEAGLNGYLFYPLGRSMLFDTIMEVLNKDVRPYRPLQNDQGGRKEDLKLIHGAKVLLVEDNETNQQVASEIFEKAGLIVDCANDGLEAIGMIATSNTDYEVVFMDIQMPKMDGYEATRIIRKDHDLSQLPIIAMTANAMSGDREKSLLSGMNDHINKPYEVKMIHDCLLQWIKPKTGEQIVKNRNQDENEQISTIPFPEKLPGLDIQDAMLRMEGDQDLYQKLLGNFLLNHKDVPNQVEDALKSGDNSQALKLLHSLKGTSGNLSAKELSNVAIEMEAAIKNGETHSVPELQERLYQEVNRVIESKKILADKTSNTGITKAVSMDDEQLINILKELEQALTIKDLKAENLLKTIREKVGNEHCKTELNDLGNHIDQLDFDSALIQLNMVTDSLKISLKE
ncbi:MAG: response regulator [Magnetococcales bacterium]|nr:response regulator [Magnetococcales bacterium]